MDPTILLLNIWPECKHSERSENAILYAIEALSLLSPRVLYFDSRRDIWIWISNQTGSEELPKMGLIVITLKLQKVLKLDLEFGCISCLQVWKIFNFCCIQSSAQCSKEVYSKEPVSQCPVAILTMGFMPCESTRAVLRKPLLGQVAYI